MAQAVDSREADKVTLLLLVLARLAVPGTSALLDSLRAQHSPVDVFAEIESVTAQLEALRDYVGLRESRDGLWANLPTECMTRRTTAQTQ